MIEKLDLSQPNFQVPTQYFPIMKHSQECLKQCLEVEKSSRFDTCTKYPLILKSSQAISHPQSRPVSPNFSIHPSMSNFSTSAMPVASSDTKKIQGSITLADSYTSQAAFGTSRAGSSCSASSRQGQPIYIAEIGWCIPTADKQFDMLFNDGVQVTVDSKTNKLHRQSLGKDLERYRSLIQLFDR